MSTTLAPYRKTIAAVLGAAGAVVLAALTDNRITVAEAYVIALAVLTAVLTYVVPNVRGTVGSTLKLLVGFFIAVVQAVALYRDAGLTPSEIALIAVSGLTALGVYVVPNADVIPGEVVGSSSVRV